MSDDLTAHPMYVKGSSEIRATFSGRDLMDATCCEDLPKYLMESLEALERQCLDQDIDFDEIDVVLTIGQRSGKEESNAS